MADPVLASAILEALTTHLREKRPDWTVLIESERRILVARSVDARAWDKASIWVEDQRSRYSYSSKAHPHAAAVHVSPRGNVRRVTYKALDDLPALCAKVEAKIAEGFAAEDAADKRREQEREDEAKREAARERRDARRAAQREAHPLAFGAGVDFKPDGWGLVLPERGDLAAVALAAVEAHLRTQKAKAAAPDGSDGPEAAAAPEGAAG